VFSGPSQSVQLFDHLTSSCDLDLGDTDLNDVCDTSSSYDTDIFEVSSNKVLTLLGKRSITVIWT